MHSQLRLFSQQLFLDFGSIFFLESPLIFLVITIHQVIWPSPGTLNPTRPPDPRALFSLFCLGSRLPTQEIEFLPRLPTRGPWVGRCNAGSQTETNRQKSSGGFKRLRAVRRELVEEVMGDLNEPPVEASMELEHAIGFAGSLRDCLQFHPNGRDVVYAAGGCVVVADLSDPHNQVFLRGHDDFITSIAVSPSGRYIASGQRGDNADIIVWDFEEKRLLYRMQSHDHGIACVSFSHDEKLLLSVGVVADNRLFVWDMATGLLNAQATAVQNGAQQDTNCAAWGGFFKDIKRRDTNNYMFATGGPNMLRLWALDPVTGTWPVMGEPLTAHGHIRNYTCIQFSQDKNWLYAGSSSGDMTSFQIKSRSLAMCKQCTQGGVESMLLLPGSDANSTTVLVGGGDGSITKLTAKEHKDLHDVMHGKTQLQGKLTSINVAPDGSEVVVGSNLGYMWRMRLSDMKNVKISEAHHGAITAVTFPKESSDRFATCSADGCVVMWDLSDYSGVTVLQCVAGCCGVLQCM